jgi:hypothetical protein
MSYVKRQTEETSYVTYTCRFCNSPASAEALSALGARCSRCFEVYCKDVWPAMKFPDGLIPQNHLAWAHRLKHRHDAGEKLSGIQVEKYKIALRIE